MAINKIFQQNINLSNINSEDLVNGTLCTYYFSILFSKFSVCNLYLLTAQLPGGSWHQLITTPVADNDGEITIQIGSFVPGTVINMIFGIQAITEVPSVAVFIVNKNTNSIVKILPKSGKKKLNVGGDPWYAPINNYPLQP